MDYQKMIIVGNATKDAEIHQDEGKVAYADFTLAVSRTKEQTTFFPIRVFGKLAESCEKVKKGVPLVPMGLVTTEKKGKLRVVGVRFGEPIYPPSASELPDFQRTDYLIDLTKLAMCEVARLLPPGQRGDFEDAEAKLEETNRRLGIS